MAKAFFSNTEVPNFDTIHAANESLKKNYEEEVIELHSQKDEIVAEKVKVFSVEKRNIQIKHEKTCAENKTFKNENMELKTEINQLKVALRYSKKKMKIKLKDWKLS